MAVSLAAGVAFGKTYQVPREVSLAAAVAEANGLEEPSEIVLAAGDYPVTATLTVTGPVTIRGAGMDDTSIYRSGTAKFGVLSIDNADARLIGVTVSNGVDVAGTGTTANDTYYAGGILVGKNGGTVDSCRIARNTGAAGWHIFGVGINMLPGPGLVANSVIEDNELTGGSDANCTGAGIYMQGGTVSNCLVRGNVMQLNGVGVSMKGSSRLLASTVTGNTQLPTIKKMLGAGVFVDGNSAIVSNCVMKGNCGYADSSEGAPDWYCANGSMKQRFYNCSATVPVGVETDPSVTPGCDFYTYVEPERPFVAEINVPGDGDIYEAVEAASDGTVIRVNGFIELTREVVLERGITLEGVGGPTAAGLRRTFGTKAPEFRLLVMNHPDAKAKGLELSGGRTLTSTYNMASGVLIGPKGGTLEDCIVKDNVNAAWGGVGGGVAMFANLGRIDRCEITGNSVTSDATPNGRGAGVYMIGGSLDNSLVSGNEVALKGGAGVYVSGSSEIRNCTIAGNTSKAGNGGGLCVSGTEVSVVNTVIFGNTATGDATDGAPDWYTDKADARASFQNCASSKTIGTGCQTENIYFEEGSYVPTLGSSLVDNGADIPGFDTVDLAGNPRISSAAIDIGCYEVQVSSASATITFDPACLAVSQGRPMKLAATIVGGTAASYAWKATHSDGTVLNSAEATPSFTFDALGEVSVELTVTDTRGNELTDSGTYVVRPIRICVAKTGTGVWPCSTWETATNDIHAAVAYAADGCEILVDGVFTGIGKAIVLNRAVTVASRTGRFKDAGFVGTGIGGKNRIFEVNNAGATVRGFTISGAASQDELAKYGGAVLIGLNGGRIEDCCLTNNQNIIYAGHGTAIACVGAKGVISRCVIQRNQSSDSRYGAVALSAGVLENSLVAWNNYDMVWATTGGGGVYLFGDGSPIVRNCTVAYNSGVKDSAGIKSANANGRIENTVSFANTNESAKASGVFAAVDWVGGAIYDRCAFGTAAPNEDCITVDDPGFFTNRKGFAFAIGEDSPLVDVGRYGDWMADATDIRGRSRKLGPRPDIGCYEFAHGLILLVR